MANDLQSSLMTKLHTVLSADNTLKAAMGGTVNLYAVWAKADAAMPYLVHRFDLQGASDQWVIRQGTYILDLWSTSTNADEVLAMKDRIITLVDEQSWDITSGGTEYVTSCRIWLQTEGFVPEQTDGIWHYATQWNCRLYRTGEVANIIGRS